MSHSRVPFDEAAKRLRIGCVPHSVRHKLALHLDTPTHANWELLAEVLDISSLETQWLKGIVIHSPHGSPTILLFERYLVKTDLTLEKFVQALEKIENLACIRALAEEYNKGSFDRALRELNSICSPTTILHPPENCTSLRHCLTPPTKLPSEEYRRIQIVSKDFNYDPCDGNCSSGSTYNSVEAEAGDSIFNPHIDSYESGDFRTEFPAPMSTVLFLAGERLPTLGYCEGLFEGNDAPLDLSQSQYCCVKVEPHVKGEHGRGCGKNSRRPYPQACNGGNEPQRKQDVCAGNHRHCRPHTASAAHKPTTTDMKAEANRLPVKMERKMENGGRNPREDPDYDGKGSDICCNCLSHSKWNDLNGKNAAATEAGAICMREPSPGSALHHPSKRVTDPLSKEELDSLEKEKQQMKNPDEATPVRITRSSYAVLQQKPFRKDSRSVRVFVTYSDDSKKHMKKVMQLCECLKNNNFSVSIDVRENHLLSQDKMGWFDKRFKVADYVLVLISPKYYTDVTDPDDGVVKEQQDESTLNTLYIHRCMQAEYMMNKCLNKRFVPVLMPGTTKEHVPFWLKNTTIYVWPDQYKNLFFYMMYPAQVISQFVRREQSAKTPTVTKTNH